MTRVRAHGHTCLCGLPGGNYTLRRRGGSSASTVWYHDDPVSSGLMEIDNVVPPPSRFFQYADMFRLRPTVPVRRRVGPSAPRWRCRRGCRPARVRHGMYAAMKLSRRECRKAGRVRSWAQDVPLTRPDRRSMAPAVTRPVGLRVHARSSFTVVLPFRPGWVASRDHVPGGGLMAVGRSRSRLCAHVPRRKRRRLRPSATPRASRLAEWALDRHRRLTAWLMRKSSGLGAPDRPEDQARGREVSGRSNPYVSSDRPLEGDAQAHQACIAWWVAGVS